MIVEHARATDAAETVALLDAAAAWHVSRGINQWRPGSFADEVEQAIADGDLFVARADGAIVGCFMLEMNDPAIFGRVEEPGAHLARLAVARSMTGRGVGASLMDEAGRIAAEAGRAFVRLQCPADNARLQRYYVENGFTYLGDVANPGPNGERWVVSLFERRAPQASER